MENLIGKRLDGLYRLDELVGSGGMAYVFKATDLKNNRVVAVKILKPEFHEDAELVRRFKNESRAISILDDPHIVKVYDVSVSDKLHYIVMEYIEGITLRQYLDKRNGKITWKETVHFVSQLLEALAHAHKNGIIHRDIKPQNIMMTADGMLHMMDFGIARVSRAGNQTLTNNRAIGSVHYISPEQAKGEATTAQSDIYSLGIMMYEMLSGKLPFDSDSAVSVALKQISDKATPLREVAPDVPEGLAAITERAMAKNVANRYQSAEEMQEALQAFKEDPDIHFEYKYLTQDDVGRVASKTVTSGKGGKQTMKKKRKKKSRGHFPIISIFLGMATAFAVVCFYLCYQTLMNSPIFVDSEDIEVIDFTGMTVDQVKESEYYQTLRIEFDEVYSSNPEGYVFSQSPVKGRKVKKGQTVTLKVSCGVQYSTMENFVGLDYNTSAEMIEKAVADMNCVLRVTYRVSNEAVGTILQTVPAAGENVEARSTVQVVVAREQVKMTATVPDVRNMTQEDAVKALSKNNLSRGTVTEKYSAEVEEGKVIEQSVEPGVSVRINSYVSIVVSKGPLEMPDLTNKKLEEVQTLLEELELECQSVTEAYSDTVKEGYVISQSIKAGQTVKETDVLTLVVSKGPEPKADPEPSSSASSSASSSSNTSSASSKENTR